MRWEETAKEAAGEVGFEVVGVDGINDYQGWGVLLLRNGNTWATLGWSYGSCCGCDCYENMDHDTRISEFKSLIDIHTNEDDARLEFNGKKGW